MTMLDRLVLEAAARDPQAIAVRQGQRQLTYAELTGRAAALARRLQAAGAGPESTVGVRMARQPDLIVAALGVLMSGAVYVPLDPALPDLRLAELTADADVRLIVDEPWLTSETAEPPGHNANDANAAYLIYTSGSAGRPKGVMITHEAITSFVKAAIEHTDAAPGTRALAFAAIGFDVSVLEIFVPLAAGATVMMAPADARTDVVVLQRFMEEHEVTWASIPPVLLPLLDPARLPWLRTLMTGDEPAGPEQVARWAAPGRRFINCYGPTETTIQVSAFEGGDSHAGPLPIGHPLAHHRLYVVDEDQQSTDGVGELLIGGAGLARGYHGRPGATAKAFIPDAFGDQPGARLYRSGDLASWNPDGQLMFHGRQDRQLKVRGQRVEPEELESVLRSHPLVLHAVVDVAEDGLVAFVRSEVDSDQLRAWCAERLPAALVPSRISRIEEFPVTPSGKVDRAALRDGTARVWRDALTGSTGADDEDFFAAGGHSLVAMRMVVELRAQTGRDLTVADLYAARTLGRLRERLAQAPTLPETSIIGHPASLTAAQRRLWFVDQLAVDSAAYNIAMAQRISGPLDVARLERAFTAVAQRHEILRWRIPQSGGVPYVEVDPPRPIQLAVSPVTEPELPRLLAQEAQSRLDLAAGPLWRARLFRLAEQEHVLAFTAHHAIFDGWSADLLYRDLETAYRGTISPLRAQFGDYAAWREERESTLAWWLDHLAGAPPVLALPVDRPRPPVQTYGGEVVSAQVPQSTSDEVAKLANDLGVTTATVFLAGYARILGELTGQETVLIGTPIADRRLAEFSPLIGFFVDIVPLRIDLAGSPDFASLVTACGQESLAAISNPAAPLEEIVSGLGLRRDPARHPLVQTLFNVFNFATPILRLDGLTVQPEPAGVPGSPFDLTAYLLDDGIGQSIEFVYNPDVFDAARMNAMLTGYLESLSSPFEVSLQPWLRAGAAQPEVAARQTTSDRVPPGSATEHAVAAIWRDLLGHENFGVTHNFFDAGGRSLSLVQMQSRLKTELGRQVTVVDLFGLPTVRSLAAHLDRGVPQMKPTDALAKATARAQARAAAGRRRAGVTAPGAHQAARQHHGAANGEPQGRGEGQ